MAKKKKDDIEDNDDLNSEEQGDINEIDDSFGLPDIEYKPLDELEETSEEITEDVEESIEQVSDEVNDNQDDSHSFEEESSEEVADEVYPSFKEEDTYQADEDSDAKSYDDLEEEAKAAEKEYVPGSYTPPKENSNAGTVIIVILLILAALAAGWYFGFYQPGQAEKAETERVALQKQAADKKLKEDQKKAELERQAEQERQKEAEAAAVAEEEANKVGTVQTISSRTSRYYVVVASNVDGDLAMDYGKKISQESGVNVTIIEPFGKSLFHRITVDAADTYADAQSIADGLKSTYGGGVWVIKY